MLLREFPHLRKLFWGRRFWARGCLMVRSGQISDEMVREHIDQQHIDQQESEPVWDDSRFPIDDR